MGKFALPKWDTNDVGDEICNTLFKAKGKNKNKKIDKIKKGGKIAKAKLKTAKTEILKNIGDTLKDIKSTVGKVNNGITKTFTAKSNEESSKASNEMNTSQQKIIKKKKKIKTSNNLPNLKHLKNIIETKLSSAEDQKNLFSEGDQTISEMSIVNKKAKKRQKRKDLKKLKNDISDKIDSNIISTKNKMKQKKKKGQLKNNTEECDMNVTIDSSSEEATSLVQRKDKKTYKNSSLRERMLAKLKASRFRYLNEQLYCSPSKDAKNLFETDPDSFKAYHDGFRQQVNRWPVNPVDLVIKSLKKMNKNYVIADFGCGDAKIAQEVHQKVHSFDLVATNERVTACDMVNVPLSKETVDVAVFCLSLMGTNLQDYLKEANRVLKVGGILKIAEVESRFDNVDEFIKGVQHFGFQNIHKDLTHNIFYFMDFKKVTNVKKTKGLPTLSLNPCLYKKR